MVSISEHVFRRSFFRKNAKTRKMKKWLSYRKIRCFVRVAMLKKTSDDAKKRIVFFIDFSSIFREKSTENRAKSVKTSIVHKNQRKSTFATPFFSKKSIFSEFSGSPRVPRGVPGRPKKFTKLLIFLLHGELRLTTSPDGLRETSGKPRRSPQVRSGYDFASIFRSILDGKSK